MDLGSSLLRRRMEPPWEPAAAPKEVRAGAAEKRQNVYSIILKKFPRGYCGRKPQCPPAAPSRLPAGKWRSGEYDESELEHAILHAMKMVRIARKKLKHLKMEEMAQNSGAASNMPDTEELEEQDPFGTGGEMEQSMDEMEQSMDEMKQSMDEMRQSMDEMQRSMEEMRQSMEEFTDEMEELEREMSCDDLADELGIAASGELTPEDLDRLRKKHRSDEQREIMEADMKYLRALFERLAQEQQNGSGGFPGGIALELSGTAVPVEAAAPAAVEGASVDVAL